MANETTLKPAKSLFPKANQTALLWDNGKVILKREFKSDSAIVTRYDSFIGTAEEVEAKIKELNLKELPAPKEFTKPETK